jgi:hypothetical protein
LNLIHGLLLGGLFELFTETVAALYKSFSMASYFVPDRIGEVEAYYDQLRVLPGQLPLANVGLTTKHRFGFFLQITGPPIAGDKPIALNTASDRCTQRLTNSLTPRGFAKASSHLL